MARTNPQAIPEKGRAGAYSWYTMMRNTYMRIATNKEASDKDAPSEAKMRTRTSFSDPIFLWRALDGDDKPSFECREENETDYAAWMRLNEPRSRVFLTKQEAEAGACVLFEAQMSHGSLKPNIEYTHVGDRMRSSISVGDLAIDAATTVGDFSTAVIRNNEGFAEGDTIGCFLLKQTTSSQSGCPSVDVHTSRVKLNEKSRVKLWDVAHPEGFTADQGYLSAPYQRNVFYCWTWNRGSRLSRDEYRCSTQFLVGDSDILYGYRTRAAFEKASASYGGYKNQYLAPYKNRPFSDSGEEDQELNPGESASTGGQGGNSGNPDPTYTISFRVEPDQSWGTVTMVPSQMPVARGTQVTLTATAANLKRFGHWSDGSTNPTLVVTADSDQELTATFENLSNGGGGTPGLGSKSEK